MKPAFDKIRGLIKKKEQKSTLMQIQKRSAFAKMLTQWDLNEMKKIIPQLAGQDGDVMGLKYNAATQLFVFTLGASPPNGKEVQVSYQQLHIACAEMLEAKLKALPTEQLQKLFFSNSNFTLKDSNISVRFNGKNYEYTATSVTGENKTFLIKDKFEKLFDKIQSLTPTAASLQIAGSSVMNVAATVAQKVSEYQSGNIDPMESAQPLDYTTLPSSVPPESPYTPLMPLPPEGVSVKIKEGKLSAQERSDQAWKIETIFKALSSDDVRGILKAITANSSNTNQMPVIDPKSISVSYDKDAKKYVIKDNKNNEIKVGISQMNQAMKFAEHFMKYDSDKPTRVSPVLSSGGPSSRSSRVESPQFGPTPTLPLPPPPTSSAPRADAPKAPDPLDTSKHPPPFVPKKHGM